MNDYEIWLDSLPPLSDAEREQMASEYAKEETATGMFLLTHQD